MSDQPGEHEAPYNPRQYQDQPQDVPSENSDNDGPFVTPETAEIPEEELEEG